MPVKLSPRARRREARRWSSAALAALLLVLAAPAAGAGSLAERAEEQVRAAAGGRALVRDSSSLDAAAAWVAREAFAGRRDPAAIRHRLWAAGVRDFEFRPLTVVARGLDPARALTAALGDPAIPWSRYTHFALSVIEAGDRTAVSVLLTRRAARFADGLEQGTLAMELIPGLDRPALFVTRPDGSVERFAASAFSGGWRVDWDPGDDPGDLLLELVAEGPRGPEVLAMWPERQVARAPAADTDRTLPDAGAVFQGDGPPSFDPYRDRAPALPREEAWVGGGGDPPDRAPVPEDVALAEDHLWALIQNAREAHGLSRLVRDVGMTRAARQHAGDIARGEPFGHLTSSGSALDRLTAHGVAASRATENVAQAAHVAEAHAALMASPAHRANLLDDDVSAGAVGVVLQRDARGRWSAVVSEVFARPLPAGGAERWAELALDAINRQRRAQGLGPVRTRDRLTSLAAEAAAGVVRSGVIDMPLEAREELVGQVRFHFNAVGRVSVDLMVTAEPARAGQLAHALEREFDEVGLGVVPLPAPLGDHPAGTPLIVLLFVQR